MSVLHLDPVSFQSLQKARASCFLFLACGIPLATSTPLSAAPVTGTVTRPAVSSDKAEEVMAVMKKAATWQMANPKVTTNQNWNKGWEQGVYYAGMIALYEASQDPTYLNAMLAIGEENKWQLGQRVYHADDHLVGQTYLKLYASKKDPRMIAATRERLDFILKNPVTTPYSVDIPRTADRWSWCDALFMGPALWAQMASITGEKSYLDFMDREWWATTDFLLDPKDKLFYRDQRYAKRRTRNGKKIFWARGNGWVYGGLVRVLNYLPANHPSRPRYIQLFKDMTTAIVKAQGADGLWRPSMADPKDVPKGETSGTALFVYGLAWGVNQGLLNGSETRPVIERGWKGLMSRVRPDGMLGSVQGVASAPKMFADDSTKSYAIGALLLAGSEIHRMLTEKLVAPRNLIAATAPASTTLAPGTWARFVPERADDFAWENDLVAFRVYGPAIKKTQGSEDSGIDCWLKRVPYPIIDKWYAGDKNRISYHKDHGEGNDPYHVGASRGCGGLAIWSSGKLVLSGPYKSWRVISRRTTKTVFELEYEYHLKGETINETKRITIELGQRLFRSESIFTKDGKPVVVDIAIGITTHDGKAIPTFSAKQGFMSCGEKIEGFGLGTGVVIEPSKVLKMYEAKSGTRDESHALLLTRTDSAGKIQFSAGYGWEKAAGITTPQKWRQFLSQAQVGGSASSLLPSTHLSLR